MLCLLLSLFFLLLFSPFSQAANTCTMTIFQRYTQFDRYFAGQNHTYQFYLTFDDYYSTLSYIRFTFPDYSGSAGHRTFDDATTDCVNCIDNYGQYRVDFDGSDAYIEFTNPKINELTYTFTVSYIQNPSSPVTVTPTCYLYDVSDALLTSITSTTVNFLTNTGDELLLEVDDETNGASTTLSFRWPSIQAHFGANPVFRLEIPPQTYNYVSYGLDVASAVSSVTITASYQTVDSSSATSLTFTTVQSTNQDSDVFELTFDFSSYGDAGEFIISFAGFTNPGSVKPLSDFFATITDTNGNVQQQLSASLRTTTAGTLGSATAFEITQNADVGADDTVYQFTIEPTNPIPLEAVVAIEGFDFVEYGALADLAVNCVQNCQSTSAYLTKSNDIFYIEGLWSESSSTAIASGSLVIFEITGFTNPQDDSEHSFSLHTLDTGYYKIDSLEDTLFLQATRTGDGGKITVSGIQILNGWLKFWFAFKFPVKFQFAIVIQSQVLATDKLDIIIDGALVVSKDAECTVEGLSTSATCYGSKSQNKLTISNFVDEPTNLNTSFFFWVNRIKKQTLNKFTSATFEFQLLDSSDNLIDSGIQTYPLA